MIDKGDIPESDQPEDNKANVVLETSSAKTEQLPSTSDKEAKTRILTARNRQTQSGPLVVLNHSKSERRNVERFHHYPFFYAQLSFFLYCLASFDYICMNV